MADVRKTNGPAPAVGVVYDLSRARQRVAGAEAAAESDSAGITEEARELGRAHGIVQAAPDVRAERVAALKKQIQNGTYQPDAKEIARQILDRGF